MRELQLSGPSDQKLVPLLWILHPFRSRPPTPWRQEWSRMTQQTWTQTRDFSDVILSFLKLLNAKLCWNSSATCSKPGWQTDLPHGEMEAYELVIWLVLMEARISPFRSHIWMLVSVEALMINFPLERKHMNIKWLPYLSYIICFCPQEPVVCTCLCNANVEDRCFVFLWKVLRCCLKAKCAVVLLHHFEDSNGISVGQPGNERPTSTTWESETGDM